LVELNIENIYVQKVVKFVKILEICKQFAGNQVNEKGNVARCGVVPTFSDLEVVALSLTSEAFGFDSENYLFNRLNKECPGVIPNLITRRIGDIVHRRTCTIMATNSMLSVALLV
jgi:hypothetical protein